MPVSYNRTLRTGSVETPLALVAGVPDRIVAQPIAQVAQGNSSNAAKTERICAVSTAARRKGSRIIRD
jgi:hypothetical protein